MLNALFCCAFSTKGEPQNVYFNARGRVFFSLANAATTTTIIEEKSEFTQNAVDTSHFAFEIRSIKEYDRNMTSDAKEIHNTTPHETQLN